VNEELLSKHAKRLEKKLEYISISPLPILPNASEGTMSRMHLPKASRSRIMAWALPSFPCTAWRRRMDEMASGFRPERPVRVTRSLSTERFSSVMRIWNGCDVGMAPVKSNETTVLDLPCALGLGWLRNMLGDTGSISMSSSAMEPIKSAEVSAAAAAALPA
jgi:hypothetical protein